MTKKKTKEELASGRETGTKYYLHYLQVGVAVKRWAVTGQGAQRERGLR